jgi:hypothetical protein
LHLLPLVLLLRLLLQRKPERRQLPAAVLTAESQRLLHLHLPHPPLLLPLHLPHMTVLFQLRQLLLLQHQLPMQLPLLQLLLDPGHLPQHHLPLR